jgi:hypothetical protein
MPQNSQFAKSAAQNYRCPVGKSPRRVPLPAEAPRAKAGQLSTVNFLSHFSPVPSNRSPFSMTTAHHRAPEKSVAEVKSSSEAARGAP